MNCQLTIDGQGVYLVFNLKREMSMKKTWSIILKVIIAVAGAIAGVVGVQAANL